MLSYQVLLRTGDLKVQYVVGHNPNMVLKFELNDLELPSPPGDFVLNNSREYESMMEMMKFGQKAYLILTVTNMQLL